MNKVIYQHLAVILVVILIQFYNNNVHAISLRQAPPEPPPIPTESDDKESSGKTSTTDYKIPTYPLPPVAALSPPSTMPFAIFDQEHSNGFT